MTNQIETLMTETIAEELSLGGDAKSVASAVMEMFKDDRIAVVELPDLDGIKRQHISFGPDAECEHECCPAWVEDDDTEISYSLDEARDLAAALLAAADAAEAEFHPDTTHNPEV